MSHELVRFPRGDQIVGHALLAPINKSQDKREKLMDWLRTAPTLGQIVARSPKSVAGYRNCPCLA